MSYRWDGEDLSCRKQVYFSRGEAEEALANARAMRAFQLWRREERSYVCWRCSGRTGRGVWHLTSESAMPSGRVREA